MTEQEFLSFLKENPHKIVIAIHIDNHNLMGAGYWLGSYFPLTDKYKYSIITSFKKAKEIATRESLRTFMDIINKVSGSDWK